MAVEYPRQLFCEWGKSINFNAEVALTPVDESDNTPPMEMHKSNLSRFPLTIVDMKSGNTNVLTANIPYKDVAPIHRKTLRAQLMMDMRGMFFNNDDNEGSEDRPVSPAYTVAIRMGQFSGKTPAEILIADPSQVSYLENTRKILADNVAKYPKNQEQIDAIDEAINLLNADELKASLDMLSGKTSTKEYIIYNMEYKAKKPERDGKKTIYSITIKCCFDDQYPWKIEITNWFAPLKKSFGSLAIPDFSSEEARKSKRTSVMSLTDEAWTECIDEMYRRLNQFENMEFPKAYERLNKLAWKPSSGGVTIDSSSDGVKLSLSS